MSIDRTCGEGEGPDIQKTKVCISLAYSKCPQNPPQKSKYLNVGMHLVLAFEWWHFTTLDVGKYKTPLANLKSEIFVVGWNYSLVVCSDRFSNSTDTHTQLWFFASLFDEHWCLCYDLPKVICKTLVKNLQKHNVKYSARRWLSVWVSVAKLIFTELDMNKFILSLRKPETKFGEPTEP